MSGPAGRACTGVDAELAVGPGGTLVIGDHCHLTHCTILCETSITIGDRVLIGWNATLSDSDFHPVDPAARLLDLVACAPEGWGTARPTLPTAPIVIEDDVWIGVGAVVLKGVRLGKGAIVEPGAVVAIDVPAGGVARGNPATVVAAE